MTDTSNGTSDADKARQWMKDMNETVDGLMDDIEEIRKSSKTALLVGAAAAGIAAVEGLGLATLFKGQKAIVDTLQAIVTRIEGPPMSPEDEARAMFLMEQAKQKQGYVDTSDATRSAPVAEQKPMEHTEVLGEVVPPAETAASEAPEWAKHAMRSDPDWEQLEGFKDGDDSGSGIQ